MLKTNYSVTIEPYGELWEITMTIRAEEEITVKWLTSIVKNAKTLECLARNIASNINDYKTCPVIIP